MKLNKRGVVALLLAGALALSSCGSQPASSSSEGGKYTAGTYTGEGQGYGGTVTVTITTDASSILEVTATGDQETPTVGGAALDELAAQVLEAQSAEIDGVSGATGTSNGVRAAAQAAIDAAMGVAAQTGEKAVVADGTYTGKAPSFGVMGEMELAVTFEDNKITKIETINAGPATQADEDEYSPIYATVDENLYPRIIESQSLAVDNIAGATVSSSAAKTILANIIDENGGDSSHWYTPIEKSTDVVVL